MDSLKSADAARAHLDAHGKSNYRILRYPGLGHLLDPPFSPVTSASTHPLVPPPVMLDCGGGADPAAHSYAQEDSWQQMLHFYRTALEL